MMNSCNQSSQSGLQINERKNENGHNSGSNTLKQMQKYYSSISKQSDRICPKFACLLKNLKYFWPPGANTEGILHHEWIYLRKHAVYYTSKMKGKNFSRRKHSSINAVAILEDSFSRSSFLSHDSLKSLQRKTGLSRLFVSSWFKWKRRQLGIKCPMTVSCAKISIKVNEPKVDKASTFLQSVYIKEQYPSDIQKSDLSNLCGLDRRVVDSWFRVTRALDNKFLVEKVDLEEMIMWRLFMRNHHKGGISDSDVDLMSDILCMPKTDVFKIFLCWCQRFDVENRMNPNTIELCRVAGSTPGAKNMGGSPFGESLCELDIQTCDDEPSCSKVPDLAENENNEIQSASGLMDRQTFLPPKIASITSLFSNPDNNNNEINTMPQQDITIKAKPLVNTLLSKEPVKKTTVKSSNKDDRVSYAMSVMNNALSLATKHLIPYKDPGNEPRIDFSDHTIVHDTLLDIRSKQTSEGIPSKMQISKTRRKKFKYQNLKRRNTILPLYFKTKVNAPAPCKSYTEDNRERTRKKASQSDDDIIFVKSYNKHGIKREESISSGDCEDSEDEFLESLSKVCQQDYKIQTRKLFRFESEKHGITKQTDSNAIHDIYHHIREENESKDEE